MDWRFTDDRPIWLQLTGAAHPADHHRGLSPGSRLPPVRELAAQAGSTPTPCSGPLAQLEQDGLAFADRNRRPAGDGGHLCAGRRPAGPGQGPSSNTTMTLWPSWAIPGLRPRSFEGGASMSDNLIVCQGSDQVLRTQGGPDRH